MRLIVNLGNSDLRVLFKDEKLPDPVFRNKNFFAQRLKDLKDAIRKAKPSFSTNGYLEESSLLFMDNEVKRVWMPILSAEILGAEEYLKKKVTEVVCFCTQQQSDAKNLQLDTYSFQPLLLGPLGKALFPSISFSFIIVKCNPSDYGLVFHEYSELLKEDTLEDSAVAIAQATPAMCLALSSISAKINPAIPHFYTSHSDPYEADSSLIKVLPLFSENEKKEQIIKFCNLLNSGSYHALSENLSENYLKKSIVGIEFLVNYFLYRSKYRFDDAYNQALFLKESNESLFRTIEPTILGLKKFSSCFLKTINSYGLEVDYNDYVNPIMPLLLYETLQNVMFYLACGEYWLAIAFTTSFLDVITCTIIARQLNLKEMIYMGSEEYPVLTQYLNNTDFRYDSKNFKPNGSPKLNRIITWLANNKTANNATIAFSRLQREQMDFSSFKNLRNRLPIAHSMRSVELKLINSTLQGRSFDSFISQLVAVVKNLDINLCFPKPYHDVVPIIEEELMKELNL